MDARETSGFYSSFPVIKKEKSPHLPGLPHHHTFTEHVFLCAGPFPRARNAAINMALSLSSHLLERQVLIISQKSKWYVMKSAIGDVPELRC